MKNLIYFFAMLFGFTSFAGYNSQSVTTGASLSDLITVCERLANNPQLKPFSAEITCRGHKTYWAVHDSYFQDLQTDLVIRAEVTMKGDRYRVDEYTRAMSNIPGSAECNVYQEMRLDYLPVTIKLNSCSDLRDLQQEGRDMFCARHLSNAPLEDEKGRMTGQSRDTCK